MACCIDTTRRRRGAAMLEAVLLLPVLILLLAAILHVAGRAHAGRIARASARHQGWVQALAGCPDQATEASRPAPNDLAEHQATAHLPGQRLAGLLGDRVRLVRRADSARPALLGGGTESMQSTFILMCNPRPESREAVAQDTFHRHYGRTGSTP